MLLFYAKPRIRSTVHRRVMDQEVIGMTESGTHQMEIIARIVQTPNRRESATDRTSLKAPIYRKYVKRREKTETTECRETSIQVYALKSNVYQPTDRYRLFSRLCQVTEG